MTNETADLGSLTVKTAKEIADKALLDALRKERADQDDFWTFYKADPLMVMAAERIEELLAWLGTEQSMHAAWRKRAEEAEAALATVRAEERAKALLWAAETAGEFRSGLNDQAALRIREAIEKEVDFAALTENRKGEG